MLEFLLLALFSSQSQGFLANQGFESLPEIEVLSPSSLPEKSPERIAPKLLENPATAVLAFDMDSGKLLFEKNAYRSQYIASLTKLMTAYIILENHALDEEVVVPEEATQINSSVIEIYQYEKLTVETLVRAMMIASANDAAVALAVHHAGTEEAFVEEMNQTARKLGFDSTEFFNASGLDVLPSEEEISPLAPSLGKEAPYGNKMSARDVLTLMRLLLRYDVVREAIAQKHFYGTSVDEKFFHEKESTNQLLGSFVNIIGGKTGFTYLAGECFTAIGKTPDGHEIITVILGSADRFGETKKLLSWIYDSFQWR